MQFADRPAKQLRILEEIPMRSKTVCVLAVSVWASATTAVSAQYSRITPMVEAIRKAEPCVVGVHPEKDKNVVGTGVVIHKGGLIVTNHHVVGKATTVFVSLHGGVKLQGQVVLDRPEFDLAFIRVRHDKDLPASPPKKESDIILGETVIAIGHPLGYTDTVSAGIVSALNREIELPTGVTLKKLIQTNANVNPGNSGGPLLNINGELIGINSAIRSDAQGIAFAIHSLTVIEVLSQAKITE
jgi:serine protease Do